ADTWTPLTLGGAPSARTGFTSVWTGSRMIVWGGYVSQSNQALNDGGLYDPVADTWSPTSTLNAPPARGSHAAVWNGQRMMIWGGFVTGPTYLTDGAYYDPATGAWSPMSSLNAPGGRTGEIVIWDGTMMTIWGGANGASLRQDGSK